MRELLFILSLLVLASCGGGGGGGSSSSDDGKVESVRISKQYEQNWIAASSNSFNEMELTLEYKEEGSDTYRVATAGDVYWTISEGGEYAQVSKRDGARLGDLKALQACPEDNRECVTVSVEFVTGSGRYSAQLPIVVKPTDANLLPNTAIDMSMIDVDGMIIQQATEGSIIAQGGAEIILSGTGSIDYDGGIKNYIWETAGIPSSDPKQEQITLTLPEYHEEKIYTIELNAYDASGIPGTKQFQLTVKPVLPVARVSVSTENGNAGDIITLIGSNSSFADGSITSYEWKQAAGTATEYITAITNSESGDVEITLPELTAADEKDGKKLDFELTVTNNLGKTDTATVAVTILPESANKAPVLTVTFDEQTITANEGQLPTANEKTTVCSTATATDSDTGMKSISWILSEGFQLQSGEQEKSIDDKATQMTSTICYTVPTQLITKTEENADSVSNRKEYQIYATAKDAHEEAEKIQTTQVNKGIAIVPVNAAPKIQLNVTEEESSITITATVTDPDPVQTGENDPDGEIITLNWQQTAGAEVQTEQDSSLEAKLNKNSLTTSIRLLKPIKKQPNSYAFSVTVKDNEGEETTATTEELQLENGLGFNGIDLTPNSLRITEKELDNNQWQLNWEQSNNVHQYIIYWRTNKAGETEYSNSRVFLIGNAETDANAVQSYTITPAEEDKNTTYYYKIRAVYPGYEIDNISQISELDADSENSISRDSNEVTYLPVPQNVYVNDDLKKIELKWNAVAEADSYRIDCKMTDNQGEIDCEAICNESGTDTVTGTTCTHEQNIVTNVFDEESRTVKSTRYDYRVIPLKENNIGRYTDKNEIYARVGKVVDISPAPEMSAANYIFEYEEGIYYLDHIGSGKVDQLRKFDVDGGEWSIIPISPFEFGTSGNWASGVDEDSNKFFLCHGSRLVSLELGSKVWEETNVDGLNCATSNHLALYEGYLIAVNSNAIQIVDLETRVLVATMDYSDEPTIFEKSLRVGDMLTVAFSLTNQSGERIGGLAFVNLDELITAAINGQRKNFEILSEFSEDLCFAGSDFALATDGSDYIYYRGQTVEDGSCYLGSPVALSFNLSSGEWSDHTYPKTMDNERAFVRRDFDIFCSDSRLFVMGGTTDLESFGSASYEVLGEELDGVFLTWNYFPGAYRARLGGRSVVYQDQIIQVGGRGSVCSSKIGDCVESYDPATGAWVDLASLNKGRWEGSSSFVYRDKIVAIGEALVETYSPNSWEVDSVINSFELDENGKNTSQVLFPTTRTGGCAVNYGDDIYIFGGLTGEAWAAADDEFRVEHFIGESNEWEFLDLSQNTLSSRQGHACRVYNGEIYLIGGNSVDNKPNSDIDVYNPETKQWRTLSAKAPFSQNLNADRDAAIYNDNIIFSNIVDFDNGDFGVNLVALHVPTGEIRVFSELPESGHGKRFGFSMASYKGATYLFGGSYGFMVSNVVSVVY